MKNERRFKPQVVSGISPRFDKDSRGGFSPPCGDRQYPPNTQACSGEGEYKACRVIRAENTEEGRVVFQEKMCGAREQFRGIILAQGLFSRTVGGGSSLVGKGVRGIGDNATAGSRNIGECTAIRNICGEEGYPSGKPKMLRVA